MQITDRKRVFNGHYKIDELAVRAPNGQAFTREQFIFGNAVAALVFDTARQLYVLTRQFRYGPEQEVLEIAAGMIDPGEGPDATVRREIHEELGYEVDALTPIATVFSTPGASTETIALYYAEVSRQTGPGGGMAGENETIEIVTMDWDALVAEPFQDAKTLVAVQWARLRR
ncbi:NUDIX domain-containing protein [Hymenobacter caeli]|uniref:GDP-mannose pyrophosphatase n=1 Tax=Hymenobacter caeli TaxID=2735894 RepID=A0ABX2FR85_9BACT|nr:NUDIX hydrolase [Hymenobacter caeli]NRT19696.1 ADP-ribose pyrophosphatase [Hymenobacter caeli]